MYRKQLKNVKGIYCLNDSGEQVSNYAYFPILVNDDFPISRDELNQRLKDNGIYARRYFHPLITDYPMYRGLPSANRDNLPHASKASAQILCLPIYPDLAMDVVEKISQFITLQ
jgi:dTDP-4-amino-4,6-dideoxygalactose transaminase